MAKTEETKLRKQLSADSLFITIPTGFAGIHDHYSGTTYTLADSLMASFGLFSKFDLQTVGASVAYHNHKDVIVPTMNVINIWFSDLHTIDGMKSDFRPFLTSDWERLVRLLE